MAQTHVWDLVSYFGMRDDACGAKSEQDAAVRRHVSLACGHA